MTDRLKSNSCRLSTCLGLVFIFFLAELIVGHVCRSLALQADAFHMLSDSISILLSLIAVRVEKKPADSHNTFGWQRASVVGPLINAVMLQTFCFTIFHHAIERFFEPEKVEDPLLMLFVGIGGLLVNLISLLILHGTHAHSHGGDELAIELHSSENANDEIEIQPLAAGEFVTIKQPSTTLDESAAGGGGGHGHSHSSPKGSHHDSIFAVQLHVLADLIGSVVVIISALIIWLVPTLYYTSTPVSSSSSTSYSANFSSQQQFNTISNATATTTTTSSLQLLTSSPNDDLSTTGGSPRWIDYVDPLLSLVLVAIVSWKNIPFLKRLAQVLMQSVPHSVQVRKLKSKILGVADVRAVHDLHVWQLHKSCCIGTVHLICDISDDDSVHKILKQVKNLFHDMNVHCTTIQVESISYGNNGDEILTDENQNSCREPCPSAECKTDQCCNNIRSVVNNTNNLTTITTTNQANAQQAESGGVSRRR